MVVYRHWKIYEITSGLLNLQAHSLLVRILVLSKIDSTNVGGAINRYLGDVPVV